MASCPALEAKYIIGKEIGRGTCSIVREVFERDGGQRYAAKFTALRDSGYNPEESEILLQCRHDNIVHAEDVYFTPTHCILILEFLNGGELFHQVCPPPSHSQEGTTQQQQAGSCPLSEATAATYFRELLKAIRYLHDEKGIVHRDIKLENVMITSATARRGEEDERRGSIADHTTQQHRGEVAGLGGEEARRQALDLAPAAEALGSMTALLAATSSLGLPNEGQSHSIKLIDFGFSKRIGTQRSLNSCCGSPNYMSPEMLRATRTQDQGPSALPTKHQRYGKEVDMWSAGVLLFVMLTGRYPFYDERRAVWHKAILLGQYAFPSDCCVSEDAKDLVSRLLAVRWEERLTAAEALAHPWLDSHCREATTTTEGCGRGMMSAAKLSTSPVATGAKSFSAGMQAAAAQAATTATATTPLKRRSPPEYIVNAADIAFTPPHNSHHLIFDTPPQ